MTGPAPDEEPAGWVEGGRGALFDTVAETYESARPGYPPAVFDLLGSLCGLGPGTEVLEVGAGAGQATADLLAAGASVHAVEPGEALAGVLRRRFEGRPCAVVVSPFEDAVLPDAGFDLACAATSFHWVRTEVGVPKLAAALRPGGSLALWWNVYGDTDRPDPFHEALEAVLRLEAPFMIREGATGLEYPMDVAARSAELDACGAFGPVRFDLLRWEGRHTPAALRAMFGTFSNWLALEEPLRCRLLDEIERLATDEFGGEVSRPYLTPIYTARRTA